MPGNSGWRCCGWKPGFTRWQPSAYMNDSAFSAFRRLVPTKRIRSVSFSRSISLEVPMGDASNVQAIDDYWGRDGLGQTIPDALAASGKHLDAITNDDLALLDQ